MRPFDGAVLLVVKEVDSPGLFGCFATEPFLPHARHFGTGECFLFRRDTTEHNHQIIKFGSTGKNDYYLHAKPDYLAVGCGDGLFGLWLDSGLCRGSSNPVPTFDNHRLSSCDHFIIDAVEVWGLAHPRSPVL